MTYLLPGGRLASWASEVSMARVAREVKICECEELAEAGVAYRMKSFYLPRVQAFLKLRGLRFQQARVLDCGCGNGISVQHFLNEGIPAYGIDTWSYRAQQWRQDSSDRAMRCLFADATSLPFAEASFDVVMSCGLLEHIGVTETWEPSYRAEPQPRQFELRKRFVAECLRVLRRPGLLYIDHPNGAFPIDFWHYNDRIGARWHWPSERFLPTYKELLALLRAAGWNGHVDVISPAGRLQFKQVGRNWWGRLLTPSVEVFLNMMTLTPFRWLTKTSLNPYLVVCVRL